MRAEKKKFSTRLMAALMAGTLAAGMMGMNVSAASVHSGNPVTTIPVTKNVLTDGNTMAPNTTFEFEVAVADAGTFNDGNKDQVVYAGKAGGLTAETGAAFTPGGKGSAAGTYTAEGSLTTDAAVFERPGVYHYTVTEKENDYEGVTTDTTSYDVYVYVYNGENNKLYVGNVVSARNGDKADLIFNNDYGKDENKDTTHDVVIKKVITGNQAVESDTFQLVVTVTGTAGEKYKVTLDNVEQNPLTSGEKATYTVTNNTEIHIYGLTEGDKVQAVEEANTQGYQATYTTGLSEGTLTISSDGSEATVTNTKNSTSPTGVILNYGPYILMIALAGSMAAFFFFKRNRKEA